MLPSELRAAYVKLVKEHEELLKKIENHEKNNFEKEQEILKLKSEVHQLRCVLETMKENENKKKNEGINSGSPTEAQNTTAANKLIATVLGRTKRLAVSAETGSSQTDFPKFPKPQSIRKLIKAAFNTNDFLKHLDKTQINELVECMSPKKYTAGSTIIKEDDTGNAFYVIEDGNVEVMKEGKLLTSVPLGSGTLFGELALLYNCTRTATVKAVSDVNLWVAERTIFRSVIKKNATGRIESNLKFLMGVPFLKQNGETQIRKLVDVTDEEFYETEYTIIQEGERGDNFFIIKTGTVTVYQAVENQTIPVEVRKLGPGDFFGEKALLKEDVRTATVKANSPGVQCLVINRENFIKLLGNLSGIENIDYGDEQRGAVNQGALIKFEIKQVRNPTEFSIKDFLVYICMGKGGFGRVDLVYNTKNKEFFALKRMRKIHIVQTKQQDHVYSEKNILFAIDSAFIVKIYQTFKDNKYIYLLMEGLFGGDLFNLMRTNDRFNEMATKFYVGCVIEAFDYLHSRGIIYRDLKPENLMLDTQGYIKVVDFGFAKKLAEGEKTWTFCGTPEYVAPEIILNKGHDRSADYWSLGILIFELMNGLPPFTSNESMNTYRMILKGIESIEFPKRIPKTVQLIIKKLCRDNPVERLGYQKDGIKDIKKHKWYEGFSWIGLMSRSSKAPFVPKTKILNDFNAANCMQVSDLVDKDAKDEFSGWDINF